MWTSKIFWKLFLLFGVLTLALTVGFLWIVSGWQRQFAIDQSAQTLLEAAHGIVRAAEARQAASLREALVDEVESAIRETRRAIVLVDQHGRFVAGSGTSDENFLAAPEIKAALHEDGTPEERRAIADRALHVAVPVRSGDELVGVVRVSHGLAQIEERVISIQRATYLLAAIATAIATTCGYFIVGRIVRPLAQLTEGAQAMVAEHEPTGILEPGDELGVLGSALSQMQRRLARQVEELRQNSQRLATVLGSMVEGVIAVSVEENILLANDASRKLLDVTVPNPVGRSLLEVTRNLAVHSAFVAALDSQSPVEQEFESTGPTRRTLSLRATRLPGNPCPGVMLVLHDVSELRRLENLRREFVANVSHELKTPLASIQAYAETLKMGALHDPEHAMTFVSRIEEQAERLHQLIIDLIQVARMESGQEAIEITAVDLAEVVQDGVEQFAAAAAARQITLVAEPASERVWGLADEEGIRTILDNLIDNAIKYTPPEGTVTIRYRREDQEAILEVQDTGIGIAEKDQARIFERFYRADKARSREMGGTGLGLAIVKHLAQAFGGSVGVESRARQGSTFCVRLRCEED